MSETASPSGGGGDVTPSKADIDRLVAALASPDRATRQVAREALVALGHPAVGPLIALLDDRKDHVRWEAAKSLSEIGDPAAAPALVKALEDQEAGVRWLAAEGLIRMRRASLKPIFQALIERSDSKWLREGAHHVLHVFAKSGLDDRVAPVLAALEGIEPTATVPIAARRALDAL
jgi:HEAT repeat protein